MKNNYEFSRQFTFFGIVPLIWYPLHPMHLTLRVFVLLCLGCSLKENLFIILGLRADYF